MRFWTGGFDVKKRYTFLIIIVSVLFLFTACGKKEYTFYKQMGESVDLSSIEEACEALGIPQSELEEKQAAKKDTVNFTLTSCFELLPDSIQADTAELYITVDQGIVMGTQLYAVCQNADYDPAEVYQIVKEQCAAIQKAYPESAYADLHEGIISVDGKAPASFTEKYATEEEFTEALSEALDTDIPFLTVEEAWWISKEANVTFTLSVRLTSDGVVYCWTAVNEAARNDYLHRK